MALRRSKSIKLAVLNTHHMVTNHNEIGIVWKLHHCRWTPERLREACEAVVREWTAAGIPPNKLAASAPGVGKNWAGFKGRQRHLWRSGFQDVKFICMANMAVGGVYPDGDCLAHLSIHDSLRTLRIACLPALIGAGAGRFHELLREVAELGSAGYGFFFRTRWHLETQGLGMGIDRTGGRESMATSPSFLLHDVFPENYLSEEWLAAPVGFTGLSLAEWIRADPAHRGVLEPFTTTLQRWAPPLQHIPRIREQLYRGGRLFYKKFFYERNDWEPIQTPRHPNPLYRADTREPWEAPDPIPEPFRAEFYKDKDPSIIIESQGCPHPLAWSQPIKVGPFRPGQFDPPDFGRG